MIVNYQLVLKLKSPCYSLAQWCPTSVTPWTVCTPPGFSVHGILQAGILEWVPISFSRESSQSRDWTYVSCISRQILLQLSHLGSPKVKDSDAGRGWGQEERGTTEDEMAGWHHWLDGRESEWTPGVGDGQGGLACCKSWGRKESDTTEQLNWTEGHLQNSIFTAGKITELEEIWHLPNCVSGFPFHEFLGV